MSRLAISSMSLGRAAHHSFARKMSLASKHGYKAIELFFEDIDGLITELSLSGSREEQVIAATRKAKEICDMNDLEILCLQPFMHYDGLVDREEHERRIQELKFWFQLSSMLETDIIQVPSSFLPPTLCSDDFDLIVSDLQKISDLGAQESPPIRFVYESLCWGTHTNTWERCWDIVQAVDRSNFGICLDTFNILGRIYADPASRTGKTENADQIVKESVQRLKERIDIKKVFYVQVVDAERLSAPLIEGHPFYHPDQQARMSWSRNCRLFYGEQEFGGYLPVLEVAKAIFVDLGYEGWVSLELFNRLMGDPGSWVPETLAARGAESWRKLVRDLGLGVDGRRQVNEYGSFSNPVVEDARLSALL